MHFCWLYRWGSKFIPDPWNHIAQGPRSRPNFKPRIRRNMIKHVSFSFPLCILNTSHSTAHIFTCGLLTGDTWKKKKTPAVFVCVRAEAQMLPHRAGGGCAELFDIMRTIRGVLLGKSLPADHQRENSERLRRSSKTPKWGNMSCRSGAHCRSGGLWLASVDTFFFVLFFIL